MITHCSNGCNEEQHNSLWWKTSKRAIGREDAGLFENTAQNSTTYSYWTTISKKNISKLNGKAMCGLIPLLKESDWKQLRSNKGARKAQTNLMKYQVKCWTENIFSSMWHCFELRWPARPTMNIDVFVVWCKTVYFHLKDSLCIFYTSNQKTNALNDTSCTEITQRLLICRQKVQQAVPPVPRATEDSCECHQPADEWKSRREGRISCAQQQRKARKKTHNEEIKRIQMGGSDSSFHTLGRSKVRRSTIRTLARYTDRQAVKHSKVTWTHGKSMNINQKLRANVTYLLHLLMKNHSPVSRFR